MNMKRFISRSGITPGILVSKRAREHNNPQRVEFNNHCRFGSLFQHLITQENLITDIIPFCLSVVALLYISQVSFIV